MLCTACFRAAGCQCLSSMAMQSSCKESTQILGAAVESQAAVEAAPASGILSGTKQAGLSVLEPCAAARTMCCSLLRFCHLLEQGGHKYLCTSLLSSSFA